MDVAGQARHLENQVGVAVNVADEKILLREGDAQGPLVRHEWLRENGSRLLCANHGRNETLGAHGVIR